MKQPAEKIEAPNIVPIGTIRLTEAYQRLLDALEQRIISLPVFHEEWLEAFENSKLFDKESQDPEVYDDELAEYLLWAREANVFLRCQIEAGNLDACVQDPETGENTAFLQRIG